MAVSYTHLKIQIVKPAEIEKRSMEIITSELNGRTWPDVYKRQRPDHPRHLLPRRRF